MINMKKLSMIMMAVLLGTASLWARPALKGTVSMKQPDGTSVSIRLVGDEYLHYSTTADGYTVVKNDRGYYVYAQKVDGQLTATTVVAHDAEKRATSEQDFLRGIQKNIAPEMSTEMRQMRSSNRTARAQALKQQKKARYNYSQFKGLIIIAEYNNCSFRYSNYKEIMEGMINQENYTGTTETNIPYNSTNRRFIDHAITCTGSMHDYFRDNSMGEFCPTFDIVGPVQVNRSQTYVNGNTNAVQLMIDACTAADSQVDFSDYDVDGDGTVDMIYFIFAGLPSYIQGNNSQYLWPHQFDMRANKYPSQYVKKDGVVLGRYACSTELFGYESYNWSVLEGIGTMCHEFSHVLGLPDFYDADYENSGGESDHPGKWSLMADGADFDLGRTPCCYSLFERYALGFATPQVISELGEFTLENLSESNSGYRMNSRVNREFFIFENRQKTKWDAQLPGHGMLIFRVDSTNNYIWESNAVNNNPNHNYYELVRANGVKKDSYGALIEHGTPFPGTANVTEISNTTSPANLKTWAGKLSLLGLRNIKETGGKITFEAYDVNVLTEIKMADKATVGVGTTLKLSVELVPEGVTPTLTWSSNNEAVATVSDDGLVTGISEGTATITVTSDNNISAQCVITVKHLPVADNIAAFCQLTENEEALLQLTDAQVLYVKGNNAYVRDASGSIMFSGTGLSLNRDNLLSGTLYGLLSTNNRMPQLVAVEGMTNADGLVITDGTASSPRELHSSQLSAHYYSDYVTVKKAQLVKDNGVWMAFGDKRVRLYNTLGVSGIKVPADLTKRYDITAIYGTNVLNGEVIDELYLLESPKAASYTAATSLALSESLHMEAGRTYQLTADVLPAGADVFLSWSSSNEAAVTVTADGLLTAVANGQSTVSVVDAETGLTATCQVTVGDRLSVNSIAEFKALPGNSEADLVLTDAQVLYSYKTDLFLRDASGAIMLSGTGLSATAGQLLNGTLFGKSALNNGMPVLVPVDGVTNIEGISKTDGGEAEPRKVKMADVTDADLCDLLQVESVQLERDNGIYAVGGNLRARLYNSFSIKDIKVPTDITDKYFNVLAIFGTALVGNDVIYELKLLKSPEEVEHLDGITTMELTEGTTEGRIYDLNGRRLTAEPTRGIFLVKKNGRYVRIAK